MYVNLPKKFITKNLMPHLSQSRYGRKPKVPLWRIVQAIIYKLKTGAQWRELPMRQFSPKVKTPWQSVYYHFNKWSKDNSWQQLWVQLLKANKPNLDLSSIQLDGSHTPAKRGGQAVAYQGRKKCKTTNALFLTDKQGLPLAMSIPVSGNHNDLFEIEKSFPKMIADLKQSDLKLDGVFMNADAGFDCVALRKICEKEDIIANIDFNKRNSKTLDAIDNQPLLDDLLYLERFCVERTNAWIDAFKTLLVRFETKINTWASFHYLAFALIITRPTF